MNANNIITAAMAAAVTTIVIIILLYASLSVRTETGIPRWPPAITQ